MAFPKWCYDDPSKHVDFVRSERAKYEASQKQNKADRAKEGLDELFEEGKRNDAQ